MKKFITLFILALIISPELFSQSNFTGMWEGKLSFNKIELRLVFRISGTKDSLTAFLDSPDQGAKDIPVNSVIATDTSIRLNVDMINGYYEGSVVKDSAKIDGKWVQGGMTFPLTLYKKDKIEEVKRPQNPQKPYPYNEEEVYFDNPKAGVRLAGTFTYPKNGNNFPAVILVTGSGLQDRDETLLNHKPFLVLSDYLTRQGIAVLRYDDRGGGKSTGNFMEATSKEFTDDALSAVNYLMTRNEVDKKRIGIAGHSEGGLVAPLAANQSDNISFIVLMAGPGITGREILLKQAKLISEAEGGQNEDIEKELQASTKIYDILINEKDSAEANKKIETILRDYFNTLNEEQKKQIPDSEMMLKQQMAQLTSPWFKFFLSYDPYPELLKVKVPVLAINGSKDLQVPPKENLQAIEKALREGGNKNFKTIELPGLNHLFQTSTTGSVSEYSKIEETFSPNAMAVIAEWILSDSLSK